jgi:hypothetical protein
MKKKKIAYFDNHTQKIQTRELSRVESIKRYFDKAFKKVAPQSS